MAEQQVDLLSVELIAKDISWTVNEPTFPLRCQAMIRYRQPAQFCTVTKLGDQLQHVDLADGAKGEATGAYSDPSSSSDSSARQNPMSPICT